MAKKRYHEGAIITQPSNERANLPQDVMIKDFPHIPCGGQEGYNDNVSGIDNRIHGDIKGNNRGNKVGRW